MSKIFISIFLLFSVLLASSCTIGTLKLYPGPELSKDQLANIENTRGAIQVTKVDEQEIMLGDTGWTPGKGSSKENAELLPGVHKFTAQNLFQGSPVVVLEVDMKAGRKYHFDAWWRPFPVDVDIKGEPYHLTTLKGCHIYDINMDWSSSHAGRFPPVVSCTDKAVFGGQWYRGFLYVDDAGKKIFFLPFIYESSNYSQPVSKVVSLEFPDKSR